MRQAVLALHAAGAVQYILSDANTYFIASIIQGYGLSHVFPSDRVFTNPSQWTHLSRSAVGTTVPPSSSEPLPPSHQRLSVRYYHHNAFCSRCPLNLCKGSVLQQHILAKHPITDQAGAPLDRCVLYLGDGGGDVCPSLLLGPRDHVLARSGGFALLQTLSKMLPSNATTTASATTAPALSTTASASAPAADTKSSADSKTAPPVRVPFSNPPLRATLHEWKDGSAVLATVQKLLASFGAPNAAAASTQTVPSNAAANTKK
jgi:hypothetical protein